MLGKEAIQGKCHSHNMDCVRVDGVCMQFPLCWVQKCLQPGKKNILLIRVFMTSASTSQLIKIRLETVNN